MKTSVRSYCPSLLGEVLLQRYEDLVSSSRLQPDQQQLTCLRHFQRLLDDLATYSPSLAAYEHENQLYQVPFQMCSALHVFRCFGSRLNYPYDSVGQVERKRKREQLLEEERRQAQRLQERRAGW